MDRASISSDFFHLSAVQGSREERTELYTNVQRGSTGVAGVVMCQELWRSFVAPPEKSGQSGGGV